MLGVCNDFEQECKDKTSIDILQRLITCWQYPRIPQTPVTRKSEPVPVPQNPILCTDEEPVKSEEIVKTCQVPMKSGLRKGQPCGGKIVEGQQTCKRHQEKQPSDHTCQIQMKTGVRKGKPCGGKIAVGELVCGKHKNIKCIHKDENGKCDRPISKNSLSDSYCRVHIKDELCIDVSRVILYTNKFGNKEHKYSELIFEGGKVIGKQNQDGSTLRALNDDDLECVKIYKLPLDEEYHAKMIQYLKLDVNTINNGTTNKTDSKLEGSSPRVLPTEQSPSS
jgi:hypothetical protein